MNPLNFEQDSSRVNPRYRKLTAQQQLNSLMLIGWYRDMRGVPCILINGHLVSLFVEDDNSLFGVTVDTLDNDNQLSNNVFWETYEDINDAVKRALEVAGQLLQGTWID